MRDWLFLIFVFLIHFSYAQKVDREQHSPQKQETETDSLTIVNIRLECHKKTHDYVILREIKLKKGEKIAQADLDKVLARENSKIFNTDLFVTSEILPAFIGKDSIDLVISVLEKWYFYPIPIFELGDRNFNEWWNQHNRDLRRLNYGLRFHQQNFRGRNEDLRFIVQFGFTQQFGVEYKIPYIDRRRTTGFSFKITYSDNNNLAYKTQNNRLEFLKKDQPLRRSFNAQVSLSKRSHFYNQNHFTVEYQRTHIDDSIAELNPNYLGNYATLLQYIGLQYTFERDLRNAVGYPLTGLLVRVSASQKGLGVLGNLNKFEIKGVYAHFLRIPKTRFYASSSFRFQLAFPENLPYVEMRGFGYGDYFIRGYESNVIDAQRFGLWKNTFKFELFNSVLNLKKVIPLEQFSTIPLAVYLKIYADFGYTHNSLAEANGNHYANHMISGQGFGLDIVTYYNMAWRFEYSFNRQQQQGFVFGMKADF